MIFFIVWHGQMDDDATVHGIGLPVTVTESVLLSCTNTLLDNSWYKNDYIYVKSV